MTIEPELSHQAAWVVWFVSAWRWRCRILLGAPLTKGPREARSRKLLASLEAEMGGSVDLDKDGRFYLATSEGRVEMHLVAEGLRKLAAIARLIATGSLLDKGALFWDEPESNLHPRLIKEVAATIVRVAQSGVQVFIGTHSLFLLRELDMILEKSKVGTRYFGLHRGSSGVAVAHGESIDDVGDLGVLDEELQQSKRFLAQGA